MSGTRVMHLNDSLDVGGAETMILSLLTELRGRGFAPSVCSMQPGGTLAPSFAAREIPVVELQKKSGIDLRLIMRLAKKLRRERIRILHTHNYYAWMYGGLACLMTPGCLHVHTQHSHLVLPKPPPPRVQTLLQGLPRQVVAVSEQVRDSLLRQGYLPPEAEVSVIHNGIDVQRYAPGAAGEGTMRIGIVARLVEVKNHDLLLRAFAALLEGGHRAELVVVGAGPLLDWLKGRCAELDISRFVRFLGERGDVQEILATLDVFVLPSRSEGLSISMLEAMASSLPVVASRVGGNPVLVSDATGILFDDNSAPQLTDALARLADDPGLRRRMGARGREAVLDSFSLEGMVENYVGLYRKILPKGEGGI